MKKKTLVLAIIVILILILLSCFYFYYFYFLPKSARLVELYSLFTDYMKDTVDYRLRLLDCRPKGYYYDDSHLCFICGKVHPCFGFSWVERPQGKLMNPTGLPYLKFKKFDLKIADFYYDGLATKFNCKKVSSDSLECDYGLKFLLENGEVKMVSTLENLNNIAKLICETFGISGPLDCRFNQDKQIKICKCEKIFVEIVKGLIRYGRYVQ